VLCWGRSKAESRRDRIRITDLKCAIVGDQPTIRITTDARVTWYGAVAVALLDIAGQAYGILIHRLLGGKVSDRVRMYRTGSHDRRATEPKHFTDNVRDALGDAVGWTMIKQGVSFHGKMGTGVPG